MSENEFNYPFDQCPTYCPKCESSDISRQQTDNYAIDYETKHYDCDSCGFSWSEGWKFQVWAVSEL